MSSIARPPAGVPRGVKLCKRQSRGLLSGWADAISSLRSLARLSHRAAFSSKVRKRVRFVLNLFSEAIYVLTASKIGIAECDGMQENARRF